MTINGVTVGNTIKVYTDSDCSVEVGSALASGSSVTVTMSQLSDGSYSFYIKSF